ncbi:DegT/DnrJ/EryC1/StrS family aminotransferase [Patescibacteria group bacterium]|nr:DegT/DnrJ/EryC1/StrS family aminotransferase [Patescibacteria group bacterium]
MKIQYASPNLRIIDFIRALFMPDRVADGKIRKYFSHLTGKKFILITNSCRTALYLTYSAINAMGEVITSPLTCKVAIDPINESGNTPIFADINLGNLNIESGDIEHRVNCNTIAIQAIHLGGVPCDMEKIISIARNKKLLLIEDCAQSLSTNYKRKSTGSFGDVSCFSLIKNVYGIGGGILATDDYEIYKKVQGVNKMLRKTSLPLVIFRVARNLLDTQRKYRPVFVIYRFIMSLKRGEQSYKTVKHQLFRISSIEKKIAAHQLTRLPKLHKMRKRIGKRYCELLFKNKIMINNEFDIENTSFTKLFVYNPKIISKKYLKILGNQGIEAMHLEQKNGSPFQKRLVPTNMIDQIGLKNYHKVHDSLISLPVTENLGVKEIDFITQKMKEI